MNEVHFYHTSLGILVLLDGDVDDHLIKHGYHNLLAGRGGHSDGVVIGIKFGFPLE